MERARAFARRIATFASFVATLGCDAPAPRSARTSNPPPEPAPVFVVDDLGVSIRGGRIELPAKDTDKTLQEMITALSLGHGAVLIHATRRARVGRVSALARALGETGVGKSTSSRRPPVRKRGAPR
jgi:hypothetical protein